MLKKLLDRFASCRYLYTPARGPLYIILLLVSVGPNFGFCNSITINKENAVVWLPKQDIYGYAEGFGGADLTVHHNDSSFTIRALPDGTFSFLVEVVERSVISVSAHKDGQTYRSDALVLKLGYAPFPLVRPVAQVRGDTVILSAEVIESFPTPVSYRWEAASGNPATCAIYSAHDGEAKVRIPDHLGNYYFNLWAIRGNDSLRFQTYVTRNADGIAAFELFKTKPAWLEQAIVYQVTPSAFTEGGSLADVTAKLDEIAHLGINTILLQPVFSTHDGGQGYDIIDYFSVRDDIGGESQLQQFIAQAKKRKMRIVLDFVPNHTSVHHPYAQDAITHGERSHYYTFYQREMDGALYGSNYHRDPNGFIYYFWEGMINLNYHNPEVQRWMIAACTHWVRMFDIDGYRFDAIWGIAARNPDFPKRLVAALKSVKPDLLCLAEDKASVKEPFQMGYDAAYDWTTDTSWVSQWSWETNHHERRSQTVFNYPTENRRTTLLRNALFNQKMYGPTVRFLENNDLPSFLSSHNLEQTKMAAALLFSLPGIPMVYNGQEIGNLNHPYDDKPIFRLGCTISKLDSVGLFPFYTKLAKLRTEHAVLRSENMREWDPSHVASLLCIYRWTDTQHAFTIVNPHENASAFQFEIDALTSIADNAGNLSLIDLMTDERFTSIEGNDSRFLNIPIPGYTTRILYLSK
ncbi:hypothetical protein JHJ32_14510 [Parapedobacter sp. ISTM3]|uniref:alpha-amylase family glycosyl hydrolase n=1 Tax=Parapedobacter sp. ISTM3 TaxID=2800130 RepID=UPI0019082E01|nr:alpha-amylase family glycosyl hydrolase [Parapedobacter sp. ISTM3]MBK1441208.1 hypothetical protein [Parapedobacter sp. ISTM3]